jgi:lipopolysaccharide biosynthesis glycosyltransferase
MLKVFIGYDHAESIAFHTLCSSIWRHATQPVQIVPLMLSQLRHVHDRDRDPLQSNDFSFTRFLVPYLCDYEGHAVFMDCDMLVTEDITRLFNYADDAYAVQVVKHTHSPENTSKYLGTTQTRYAKKNWSSVMLFNNDRCRALTPEYVNTAHGLELHQFKWLDGDYQIGDLPLEWNFLVDYYPKRDFATISNLHFTEGGPYFEAYRDCSYAREWWAAYDYMRHCKEGTLRFYSEVAEQVG